MKRKCKNNYTLNIYNKKNNFIFLNNKTLLLTSNFKISFLLLFQCLPCSHHIIGRNCAQTQLAICCQASELRFLEHYKHFMLTFKTNLITINKIKKEKIITHIISKVCDIFCNVRISHSLVIRNLFFFFYYLIASTYLIIVINNKINVVEIYYQIINIICKYIQPLGKKPINYSI